MFNKNSIIQEKLNNLVIAIKQKKNSINKHSNNSITSNELNKNSKKKLMQLNKSLTIEKKLIKKLNVKSITQ